jgi:hypothetical protein
VHAIGDAATHLAIPCLDTCIHWHTSFKACGSSWSYISVHGMRLGEEEATLGLESGVPPTRATG